MKIFIVLIITTCLFSCGNHNNFNKKNKNIDNIISGKWVFKQTKYREDDTDADYLSEGTVLEVTNDGKSKTAEIYIQGVGKKSCTDRRFRRKGFRCNGIKYVRGNTNYNARLIITDLSWGSSKNKCINATHMDHECPPGETCVCAFLDFTCKRSCGGPDDELGIGE